MLSGNGGNLVEAMHGCFVGRLTATAFPIRAVIKPCGELMTGHFRADIGPRSLRV